MNTKRTFRELALDIGRRSPCKIQVGAVLSDRKGRVISWGWNHYDDAHKSTVHAEEYAFKRANPDRIKTGGITLTVAGSHCNNHTSVYSRPCIGRCLKLVLKHKIKIIEYTTREGGWEKITVSSIK
ncbi:MAG: hypothetical protein HY225_04230 [Candidatus Vogelbacteria bacterium]|nr:hypothetical protein [Candidatus Vogelbacteria bacterium]